MIDLTLVPNAALLVESTGIVGSANVLADRLFDRSVVGEHLAAILPGLTLDRAAVDVAVTCLVDGDERRVRCDVGEADLGIRLVLVRRTVDDAVAETIGVVSHELRSPLTSLRGFLGLLGDRWDRIDDDEKRALLEQIDVDAARVGRLVTELLDVSRLDAGRLGLRPERLVVAKLLTATVERLSVVHPQLRCHIDIEPGLDVVVADRLKTEQIIANLVENAAKYGSADEVTVCARAGAGGVIEICVIDRGPGVADGDADRIFDRFYQGGGRPDGLGLGLFISRGLAEAHGGRLELVPNDAAGACFCLTLPNTHSLLPPQ